MSNKDGRDVLLANCWRWQRNQLLRSNILYIYIYIYISAVKISALTQVIRFFFSVLSRQKYSTPLTQGRSLGLATQLITANSVSFFLDKKCIYSVAERIYEHIKQDTFQTRAAASFQRQVETVLCSQRVLFNTRSKVPARA